MEDTTITRQRELVGSALSSIIRSHALTTRDQGKCAPDACQQLAKLGSKGHYASVTFCQMKDDPSKMRLYSSNWKAEYELNGIYDTAWCRALYREMVAAGAELLEGAK